MDIHAFTQTFLESEPVKNTISETVAIDPTEAIKNSYILEEVMEEKKEALKSPDDAMKASPWLMFRRYMEYFRMHYVHIGMVHPMLSVGKDRIAQWRRAVDEYEKLFDGYFPYVSLVTEKNFSKIQHMIPTDILDLAGNPGRYIIAAYQVMLPEGEGGVEDYPLEVAGVMSFNLRNMDGETIVVIDWLRSDKEHQDANALDALMAEMLYMLKDTPVSGITFDMRFDEIVTTDIDEDGNEIDIMSPIASLMERWYFEASMVPDEELITDAGSLMKIVDIDPEGAPNTEICSIDKMSDDEFKEVTSRYIKEDPGVYDNGIPFANKKRYDRKMSYFARKKGAIVGILLVYRNYRDEIYVEMARGDSDEITMELILTALEEVSEIVKKDQQVIIPVKREYAALFTEKYLPDAKPTVLIRSTLLAPDESEDITSEEWDEVTENIEELMPEMMEVASE